MEEAPREQSSAQLLPNDVHIRNVYTGLCIDLPGHGVGQSGQPVEHYRCDGGDLTQHWYYTEIRREVGRGILVQLRAWGSTTNNCIDVPFFAGASAGTELSMYECRGPEDNQYFWRWPHYDVGGNYLGDTFRHEESNNLCIDVRGHRPTAGGERLTLWTCDAFGNDHLWVPVRISVPPCCPAPPSVVEPR